MNRFNGTGPVVSPYDPEDLELHTWFERDRQYVALHDPAIDETIIEFWDDAVTEMVEDGFLDPSDWHGSLFKYARDMEIIV